MNARELLASLREMLDDETEPYLWPTASLLRRLNNAVREACIRARLLKDDEDSLPGLCRVQVAAGQTIVRFRREILAVRNGRMSTGCHKLWALTAASMDRFRPEWQNDGACAGEPEVMVMDLAQKRLRLYPAPSAAGTLYLRVWRAPLACEAMTASRLEACPAIDIPDAEELCHWAAHESYLVKDAETEDKQAAADHLALFTERFGPRPSLHEMARWADSPPRLRQAHMY